LFLPLLLFVDCKSEYLREEITDRLTHVEEVVNVNAEEIKRLIDARFGDLEALLKGSTAAAAAAAAESPVGVAHNHDSDDYPSIDLSSLTVDKSKILGKGGFGIVYAGTYMGEAVAVKTFKSQEGRVIDSKALRELKREASILYRVGTHPCIIRMYGANFSPESGGSLCVVLELAEGSLFDALYTSRLVIDLSIHSKVRILLQIAQALDFIVGQCEVVFRDLKPLNVLLKGSPPHAKIADFGLAKRSSDVTSQAFAKGTPPYMAPEVFGATIGSVPITPMIDVYAYGILLNELMTEQKPFEGCDLEEIARRVLQGERPEKFTPKSPHDVVRTALRTVCDVCLDTDPTRRPTFKTLVSDLMKIHTVAVDFVKSGNTSVFSFSAISLDCAAGRIPLSSLSVESTAILLRNLRVPEATVKLAVENDVDGLTLSYAKEVAHLEELGLSLPTAKASALISKVAEFNDTGGVPSELVRSVVVNKSVFAFASPIDNKALSLRLSASSDGNAADTNNSATAVSPTSRKSRTNGLTDSLLLQSTPATERIDDDDYCDHPLVAADGGDTSIMDDNKACGTPVGALPSPVWQLYRPSSFSSLSPPIDTTSVENFDTIALGDDDEEDDEADKRKKRDNANKRSSVKIAEALHSAIEPFNDADFFHRSSELADFMTAVLEKSLSAIPDFIGQDAEKVQSLGATTGVIDDVVRVLQLLIGFVGLQPSGSVLESQSQSEKSQSPSIEATSTAEFVALTSCALEAVAKLCRYSKDKASSCDANVDALGAAGACEAVASSLLKYLDDPRIAEKVRATVQR
jgi:hypothetical protein